MFTLGLISYPAQSQVELGELVDIEERKITEATVDSKYPNLWSPVDREKEIN